MRASQVCDVSVRLRFCFVLLQIFLERFPVRLARKLAAVYVLFQEAPALAGVMRRVDDTGPDNESLPLAALDFAGGDVNSTLGVVVGFASQSQFVGAAVLYGIIGWTACGFNFVPKAMRPALRPLSTHL